jgi:hypothetical protein
MTRVQWIFIGIVCVTALLILLLIGPDGIGRRATDALSLGLSGMALLR